MININLNEILKQNNKTIYWLSNVTGIDQHTLHNIARNNTQKIYFSTLDKILTALDCSVSDLIQHNKD